MQLLLGYNCNAFYKAYLKVTNKNTENVQATILCITIFVLNFIYL
jgi:hypothetical protein